ncbi:MAG: hypothetical protein HC866_10290 [Leptolyngbyaceae cyanobacterium RU_5_1]|nr:hypothetical protein [Leptolyngbyaceae cyanobacterium RU_5_1]
MTKIDNQTQLLNNLSDVQELTDQTAAALQGGALMTAFEHDPSRDPRGRGRVIAAFNFGSRPVISPRNNDQISSIRITGGVWEFFEHINFGGAKLTLGAGNWNLGGSWWNDKISSFRRVA